MRILIIDSDFSSNKVIDKALKEFDYPCDIVETIKDAKYYLDVRNYDLIFISNVLIEAYPGNLITEIKMDLARMPLIVLADNADNQAEIEALRAGADDYIRKPFDVDVLLARMEARLGLNGHRLIEIEELIINPDEEKVTYQEQAIDIKGKPFEVFLHLAKHRNQIVSKEQLLDAIWIDPELVTPQVIEVAINQIRQKIDKPFGISTIETIRRRGYRFSYPKKL